MVTILMILVIIVSFLLMAVVLIQSSKGGGLAGTFGGGDASMVFGVRRTADFLIKVTTILGTLFLLFSLVTNIIINKGAGDRESIIQQGNQQTLPPMNAPTEQQFQNQQSGEQPPADQNQQPPAEQNQPPTEQNQPPR
jgi:preprotein translocase subunit SecG